MEEDERKRSQKPGASSQNKKQWQRGRVVRQRVEKLKSLGVRNSV